VSYGQYSPEHRQSIPARLDLTQKEGNKRQKHVFGSNDTGIEHVWANPLTKDGQGYYQTHATNPQRNFYFKTDEDGTRVLYSYRDTYPIASLFDIGKGRSRKRVYLIRSGKAYSVTTSGHINLARLAVPDKENMFHVPYVTRYTQPNFQYPDTGRPDKATHAANLADYITQIQDLINTQTQGRASYRIEHAHTQAITVCKTAKRYARVFGLKLPKLPNVPKLDKAKLATIKTREAEREARAEAKRKAEREAYEARYAAEVAVWEASGYCKHTPHHTLGEKWTCEKQTEHEDWEANKLERIASWKRGEDVTLRISYDEYALLRVKQEDGAYYVQTSMHVSVLVSGLAGAARLLRVLQALKANARTYQRNGHTEHIGQFTVDSFKPAVLTASPDNPSTPEWILTAGCHRIVWSEIESIAQQVTDAESLEAQQGLQA
jgi:hypothetical protein